MDNHIELIQNLMKFSLHFYIVPFGFLVTNFVTLGKDNGELGERNEKRSEDNRGVLGRRHNV